MQGMENFLLMKNREHNCHALFTVGEILGNMDFVESMIDIVSLRFNYDKGDSAVRKTLVNIHHIDC